MEKQSTEERTAKQSKGINQNGKGEKIFARSARE